jgi:hypothetical protein
LSSGVWSQTGQHSETLSQKEKKKKERKKEGRKEGGWEGGKEVRLVPNSLCDPVRYLTSNLRVSVLIYKMGATIRSKSQPCENCKRNAYGDVCKHTLLITVKPRRFSAPWLHSVQTRTVKGQSTAQFLPEFLKWKLWSQK